MFLKISVGSVNVVTGTACPSCYFEREKETSYRAPSDSPARKILGRANMISGTKFWKCLVNINPIMYTKIV